ncbi:MAG: histidine kinase [Saprospiraceae bacterium]|nr:histidine kinase [Saprospiraceae bacterium]
MFGVGAGLSSSHVSAIDADDHGYIWLSTYGAGISKFDGNQFQNFTDPQKIGGLYYLAVFCEGDTHLFGGEKVLTQYANGSWDYQKADFDVHHIAKFSSDHFLLCTSHGVLIYGMKARDFLPVTEAIGAAYQSVVHDETYWVISDAGLWTYHQGIWKFYDQVGLDVDEGSILAVDADQTLWLATNRQGLTRWRGDHFHTVASAKDLPGKVIHTLTPAALGALYLGTDAGLIVWHSIDSLWQSLSTDAFTATEITGMTYDAWNNAYISSSKNGLIKYAAQDFIFHQGFGTLSGQLVDRFDRGQGQAIISYTNGLVDKLSGEIKPFPNRGKKTLVNDVHLSEAKFAHTTWLTSSEGLYIYADGSVQEIRDTIFHGRDIHSIAQIDSTRLFISTTEGISQLSLEEGQDSARHWNISDRRLLAHSEGADMVAFEDQIWFYTSDQLGCIDITKPEEKVTYFDLENRQITSLAPMFDRYLMIATRDDGIWYFDRMSPQKLAPIPRNEVLPTQQIRSLAVNGEDLWISTRNKIMRMRCEEDLNWEMVVVLNQARGLPRLEFVSGDAHVDRRGHVFFAARRGILELTADLPSHFRMGPLLHIQSIKSPAGTFKLPKSSQDGLVVSYDQSDLTIILQAVDQNFPLGMQYEWRLAPLREEWLVTANPQIDLLSLKPDEYLLSVRAKNRSGVYSATSHQAIFIQKPFWMRNWFVVLGIGVLALGLYLIYRWRMRVIFAENLQRTQQLEDQNRLLKLEQSALRLQMNPHFIFNALHSIQEKVMQGDRDQARLDIQSFATLMRNYLDQARHELISLDEEIAALHQYLRIEQLLNDGAFDYEVVLPDDFDPSFYELPPMLIQPFVENAIKHGLPVGSKKGIIKISFSWKGRFLSCAVSDNGRGFSERVTNDHHRSAGMKITQERLEAFFNDNKIDPISMGNRMGENQEILGAWISILLPIQK